MPSKAIDLMNYEELKAERIRLNHLMETSKNRFVIADTYRALRKVNRLIEEYEKITFGHIIK